MPVEEPILRVLCVDDMADYGDMLGLLLELVGYEVRVCYDGPSALAAADDFRPDAVLLDLNMPGMDGAELGRRLRARPWADGLPLVALTGACGEDARRRTAAAGFDLHLVKPVQPDRLATALADLVILRADERRLAAARPVPA